MLKTQKPQSERVCPILGTICGHVDCVFDTLKYGCLIVLFMNMALKELGER